MQGLSPPVHTPRQLQPLWAAYAALPMEPLLVRATLATPYIAAEGGGALHLDGLLAWCVMRSFPRAFGWAGDACVVPLPLQLLWRTPAGVPLFAGGVLRPLTPARTGTAWWHKRYPLDRHAFAAKQTVDTGVGQYKDRRIPVTLTETTTLAGFAFGHRETVAGLLAWATHVGKRRAEGRGLVARWEVLALPEMPLATVMGGRPVPWAWAHESGLAYDAGTTRLLGWTPPYWYAPWHLPTVVLR